MTLESYCSILSQYSSLLRPMRNRNLPSKYQETSIDIKWLLDSVSYHYCFWSKNQIVKMYKADSLKKSSEVEHPQGGESTDREWERWVCNWIEMIALPRRSNSLISGILYDFYNLNINSIKVRTMMNLIIRDERVIMGYFWSILNVWMFIKL